MSGDTFDRCSCRVPTLGEFTTVDRVCPRHGDSTALPLNVYPIGAASEGRRIARKALVAEATAERLRLAEQAAKSLVDRARRMRLHYEQTGELRWEAVGEQLDTVAGLLCQARDGG